MPASHSPAAAELPRERRVVDNATYGTPEGGRPRGAIELAAEWRRIDSVDAVPQERLALDPLLLAERLHENPLVHHLVAPSPAVTFSDFVTRRELHRRELYQVFYKPLGVEFQLASAVAAGPPLVVVAFNRQQRDFGPEDRRLLDLV
ncbi:MAG: hypothetical protein ACRDLK_10335, partial [Gaiellaceae bacterium]